LKINNVKIVLCTRVGKFSKHILGGVILKKALLILLSITFFFSAIPVNVLAAEEYTEEEEELALDLEFMFEEAMIFDESGNPIGFDMEKIESRYGEVPTELKEIENEMANINNEDGKNITPMINPSDPNGTADKIRSCMRGYAKSQWGTVLSGSVLGTFYGYIKGGSFIKAAKLVIKHGGAGTVAGIAGGLTAEYAKCAWKAR